MYIGRHIMSWAKFINYNDSTVFNIHLIYYYGIIIVLSYILSTDQGNTWIYVK
jgi:hypothetical protein